MSSAFIQRMVLPCRDVAKSLSVYRDVLGFSVSQQSADGVVDLDQSGADGGGIRLVPVPGPPVARASLACPGPYGMTIYTMELDDVLDELGRAIGTEPIGITYPFPGTGQPVREGTVSGPDGINIFMVEYDPSRHRCRLTDSGDDRVSEIVAVGFVVSDVDDAVGRHEEALGATTYMNTRFGGPGVERMNGLNPGEELHVAFLKGVHPGSARLELLGQTGELRAGDGQVEGVRVTCLVPDALARATVSLVPGAVIDRVPAGAQTR
jgi:catechol 2,3-dioxygenase-like lactoylglutathione lyase family enzyme